MAVHNGERYVRQAVASILNQTFDDLEFIVVDDGSTDGTTAVLNEFTDHRLVRLQNIENEGLSRSLNRALEVAQGDLIARQDADDVSHPNRIATQVAFFRDHSKVGVLGTAYNVIDPDGFVKRTHRQPTSDLGIRWQMLFHNAFCHTSVMFRRHFVVQHALQYDERLRSSQDYSFWARCLEFVQAANLKQPLVSVRKHPSQVSVVRAGDQQVIANEISADQLGRVLPEVDFQPEQVARVRHWFYGYLAEDDISSNEPHEIVLKLLGQFLEQVNAAPSEKERLRRSVVGRVLAKSDRQERRQFMRLGLTRGYDRILIPLYRALGLLRGVKRIVAGEVANLRRNDS